MRIYIESNGCTRRNSELSRLSKYFILNGYEIINNPKKADYILLNTCAFKKKEEDYSISRVKVFKDYPAKLIVYGCLPDIAPSKFKEFSHIAHIAPKNIDKIDSHFEDITIKFSEIKDSSVITDNINLIPLPTAIQKFRSEFEFSNDFCLRMAKHAGKRIKTVCGLNNKYFNLFICRGCLGNCSYCAIKNAIGAIKSRPVEVIINEFKEGIKAGYRDFIILGDDVGAYGRDNNSTFPKILSHLVEESDKLSIKSSSKFKEDGEISFYIEEIAPKWLMLYKETLLDLLKSEQIKSILCPIQSGSDRLLRLMNR
jgi:tRNA A37 methylthiotransferase MiaB